MDQKQPTPTPEPITPEAQPTSPQAPITPPVQQVVVAAPQGGKGFAITSMVLGIISVVICLIWPVSIPLAIIAVVFAIIALVKRRPGKGMSIAGLVTGGVTLLIMGSILLVGLIALAGLGGSVDTQPYLDSQYQQQFETDSRSEELFN
jgi:hypothetical protein